MSFTVTRHPRISHNYMPWASNKKLALPTKEPMDQDSPNYRDHMVRADLLSLFEGAAMVADGYFIDISGLPFGDGQDLGMLTPSHSFEFISRHEIPAEEHIAAIDVGEGRIVQNVKK